MPTHRYTEKPWFFKAGRLNMLSGEPLGLYFKTPWFALSLSQFGVHLPS